MLDSLPKLVDDQIMGLLKKQVPLHVAHGLILERQHSQEIVANMIADILLKERENLRAEIFLQINKDIANHIPSNVDSFVKNYMSGHILHVHPKQDTSVQEQQHQLYLTMKADPQAQQDELPIWLALKYKFERQQMITTPYSYATDDDELPTEKVSQELVEEMS
ncbi:hypothetical protein Tco_0749299 [Tanacetum coccineum]|uniref:Uncharacterized protein n=1 Tax=Tanacetum coccineum TaxID=301880 RepID=A0ABQ4Z118_9ASTR